MTIERAYESVPPTSSGVPGIAMVPTGLSGFRGAITSVPIPDWGLNAQSPAPWQRAIAAKFQQCGRVRLTIRNFDAKNLIRDIQGFDRNGNPMPVAQPTFQLSSGAHVHQTRWDMDLQPFFSPPVQGLLIPERLLIEIKIDDENVTFIEELPPVTAGTLMSMTKLASCERDPADPHKLARFWFVQQDIDLEKAYKFNILLHIKDSESQYCTPIAIDPMVRNMG